MQRHPTNTIHSVPIVSTSRILSAIPLALSLSVLLFCGVGYIWSLFFDLPGHSLAALISIPALLASLIISFFIRSAFRHDPTCRRISQIGIVSTILVLVVCMALLIAQSLYGPKTIAGSSEENVRDNSAALLASP